MKFHEDWVEKARAVHIEDEIARRGIKLRGRIDREGSCPVCGGEDRFSINTKKQVWNCRGCAKGGDVIDLVEHLDGVDFRHACETLTGESLSKPNGKDRASPSTEIRVAEYSYNDASGNLLFVVDRIEFRDADGNPVLKDGKRRKQFRQRRPGQPGQWIKNVDGVRLVPYRLPELIEAIGNLHMILIVEGEAKVDLLHSWNIPATCCAQGALAWTAEHAEYLRNASVVILPDADASGRRYADIVGTSLQGIAASVRVLELPGLPPKGDIVDWANAGGTVEQLHVLIEREAEPWSPTGSTSAAQVEAEQSRLIRSSAEFVAGFVPPDYLLLGILQRRFCYALTAATNTGKTAILLLLAASAPLGRAIGERGVERGRVLYLAGENPTDHQMRWIAMGQQMDFDVDNIGVHFIPGRFSISAMMETVRAELTAIGGVTLIIVDTSAAYFEGDDENNNTQAARHGRMLRSLTELPGGPCVLAACHPIKNASEDNLLPRGGGAFLNEIDGNLTAKRNDSAIEVHWQGKFRGPDFAPMSFQLRTVTHERLKDSKGRLLPTVVASDLSEIAQEEMAIVARSHENMLLKVLSDNADASLTDLAKLLDWKTRDGKPYKMLVSRVLTTLTKAKLISKDRGAYTLTPKGVKAISKDRAKEEEEDQGQPEAVVITSPLHAQRDGEPA
jgi:hypothetical protein